MSRTIHKLNGRCLLKIFNYLSISDLKNVMLVCRKYHQLIVNESKFYKDSVLTFENFNLEGENPDLSSFLLYCSGYIKPKYQNIKLISIQYPDDDETSGDDEFWKRYGHDLRSLRIIDCRFSLRKVLEILENCPKIVSVKINRLVTISNDILGLTREKVILRKAINGFTSKFTNLTTFSFHLMALSCEILNRLLNLFPRLENVSIYFCCHCYKTKFSFFTNESEMMTIMIWKYFLGLLVKHDIKIRSLKIHGTLQDELLDDMVDACDHIVLETFKYENCNQEVTAFNRFSFDRFIMTQIKLKKLSLKNITLSSHDIKSIVDSLSDLECLKISRNTFTSTELGLIGKLKNITELRLGSMENSLEKNLPELPELKCFEMNVSMLSWKILSDLVVKYQNLTTLSLRGGQFFTNSCIQIIFKCLWKLEHLELCGINDVTDAGMIGKLNSILSLSKLKSLVLKNSNKITDLSLKQIAKLEHLTKLVIDAPKLTGSGFEFLSIQNRNLRILHIFYCDNLTVNVIETIIHNLANLTDLNVETCRNPFRKNVNFILQNQRWIVWSGHLVNAKDFIIVNNKATSLSFIS